MKILKGQPKSQATDNIKMYWLQNKKDNIFTTTKEIVTTQFSINFLSYPPWVCLGESQSIM